MRGFAVVVGLAVVAAGCLFPTPEPAVAGPIVAEPAVRLGLETRLGASPAFVAGETLEAPPSTSDGLGAGCVAPCVPAPCNEKSCARIPFDLDIPAGFWEERTGHLEVSVAWPPDSESEEGRATLTVRILDSSDAVLAEGAPGWFAATALLANPASGPYVAEVQALRGASVWNGVVQLDTRAAGGGERLLPDLVTLPPSDLHIERRPVDLLSSVSPPLEAAVGIRNCQFNEIVEAGARRCLRFSNAVGNLGPGALEARLTPTSGALSVAGQGEFLQRIHASDGSFEDIPVGPATFHAVHAHFHYSELAHYSVYTFDEATSQRGELVNEGRKAGFCFLDSGLVRLGLPDTAPRSFSGAGCTAPEPGEDFFMGISANWYDLYYWGLSDQFVDMTGAPDGTYELVSTANYARTLLEVDLDNNDASVVFRLEGDEITVISARSSGT